MIKVLYVNETVKLPLCIHLTVFLNVIEHCVPQPWSSGPTVLQLLDVFLLHHT